MKKNGILWNQFKEGRNLYTENYKTLWEQMKEK